MKFPKLGQQVILLGTITSVFCSEDTHPSRQAFNVRLADGQALHTNICNLSEVEAEEPLLETAEVPTDETTYPTAVVSESADDPATDPAADGSGETEPIPDSEGPAGASEGDGDASAPTDDPASEPTA